MAAGYDKENQSRAEKEVQNLIERGWPDLYHFVTTSTDPLGFDAFCILKRDKDRRTGFQSGKFKDLQKKRSRVPCPTGHQIPERPFLPCACD